VEANQYGLSKLFDSSAPFAFVTRLAAEESVSAAGLSVVATPPAGGVSVLPTAAEALGMTCAT
jgi:hypothetical protein